jgi:predicted Zn-dependent peptidase
MSSLAPLVAAALTLIPTSGEALAPITEVAAKPGKPHVILAKRPSAEAVMRIQFSVGSFDDGFDHGLTRLGQRALMEASTVRNHRDWAQDLFQSAATLEIETGVRTSAFVLRAPENHFHALAKRLIDMVFSSKIAAKDFATARTRAITDQMRPGSGADLNHFLARSIVLLGGGKPGQEYTNPPHGAKDTLRALSQKKVENHLKRYFTPGNATVIVAGSFSERKVKKILKKKKGGSRNTINRPDVEKYLPVEQTHLHLRQMHLRAFPLDLGESDKVAAARIVESLVQWRILWLFRSKGWLYSPWIYAEARPWMDFLVILLPVYSKKNLKADAHLDAELKNLANGSFPAGAFEQAKGALLADLQRIDDDPTRLAEALGRAPGRVDWHSPGLVAAIRAMDEESFKKIAVPWLQKERVVKLRFGQNL